MEDIVAVSCGGSPTGDFVLHTGIELTLQIQNDMNMRATLKEFKEKLAGDEKYQMAVRALREEVESFASAFPLPGLPDI
jgi:glycine hydroxymethyltransferase